MTPVRKVIRERIVDVQEFADEYGAASGEIGEIFCEQVVRVQTSQASRPKWLLLMHVCEDGEPAFVEEFKTKKAAEAEFHSRRISVPRYKRNNPWPPGTIRHGIARMVADGHNAKNPCVLVIEPGVYNESIVLPEGISLAGKT
jgi:hypothetical protein